MKASVIANGIMSVLLIGGLSGGCDRVELRPKKFAASGEKPQALEGEYLRDGKGGLFQNIRWYEYEMGTHIIWSRFDIFALRTRGKIHKLQIRGYYDVTATEAGLYRVALGTAPGTAREIDVDARACGNPFTNPDHAACLADPTRYTFTYLNLDRAATWKMSDTEAKSREDWDVAFRGTEIKLNSGTSGPGDVVGGLLRRFDFFDDNGSVDVRKLRDPSLKKVALAAFDEADPANASAFYLPDGIDRVIHERDWYSQDVNSGVRTARPDSCWLVKSAFHDSPIPFRVADVAETIDVDGVWRTRLRMQTRVPGASSIGLSAPTADLDIEYDSAMRTRQICISLFRQETWTCTSERTDWELRLLVANQKRSGTLIRDWRFFVNQGAKPCPVPTPFNSRER